MCDELQVIHFKFGIILAVIAEVSLIVYEKVIDRLDIKKVHT